MERGAGGQSGIHDNGHIEGQDFFLMGPAHAFESLPFLGGNSQMGFRHGQNVSSIPEGRKFATFGNQPLEKQ